MKPRFLLIASLVLINTALATMIWMSQVDNSIGSFASPISAVLPAGRRTTPLTGQLVLVIAEDLRAGSISSMPATAAIARLGSTSTLQMAPNARPADLLSGAPPDLARGQTPWPPETLVATVRRAGGTTVMASPSDWLDGLSPPLTEGFAPAASSLDPTGEIVSRTLRRLDSWLPDLAIVVIPGSPEPPLPTGEVALPVTGTLATPAADAPQSATVLDGSVRAIWEMMQRAKPGNTALILTGVTDGAPVVMAGRGLTASPGAKLTPGDITLTSAALLGAPLPSSALGRIQLSLIQVSEAAQAEKQLALGEQRQALADAYLAGISRPPTGEEVESDLVVAQSALTARNYESAFRLAGHAVSQSDSALQLGIDGRLARERLLRLPVLALALFPLVFLAMAIVAALVVQSKTVRATGLAPRRLLRSWGPATTIGVGAAIGACLAFQWPVETRTVWQALIWSLGGGVAVIAVLCAAAYRWRLRSVPPLTDRDRLPAGPPISVALGAYCLSLAYVTLLQPAGIYYLQGPVVTWYLPDPAALAQLKTWLGYAFVVALLTSPLPWAGSVVYTISGWAWRWLSPRAQIAILGARQELARRVQKNPEA